jgi:acyl carrier protein
MENRVIELLNTFFKVDTITLDSTQSDVAEWDSLRHLSLIVKIEEEFDLDFDPIEIGDMTSVASICAYIKQNI